MKAQDFLADEIAGAVQSLEAAYQRLPADKRRYSAGGEARSAADMLAEVALLHGATADILRGETAGFPNFLATYNQQRGQLSESDEAMTTLLHANAEKVRDALRAASDDTLKIEMDMPWGKESLATMASHALWNARYHEGQINFIASMLGCLKTS